MEKVVLALVGCGYWGKNYVNTIKNMQTIQLKYIIDITKPSISLPYDTIFSESIEDVLKDEEVKGIIIATPPKTHYSIALKALNAGKNVLIEKPITMDSMESKELVLNAKENNKILMVGHIFKYNNALREIKKMISRGDLGKIKYIDSRRVSLGPIRNQESALWDLITHDIYTSMYLIDKMPISISYNGSGENGIDEISTVNLKFPDNIFVSIYANWGHPVKERRIIIGGSEKAILFDDIEISDKLKIYNKGVDYFRNPKDFSEFSSIIKEGDTIIPKLNFSPPLYEEILHFSNCINGKENCFSDGEEGHQVVLILEAAEKSKINEGREIFI